MDPFDLRALALAVVILLVWIYGRDDDAPD